MCEGATGDSWLNITSQRADNVLAVPVNAMPAPGDQLGSSRFVSTPSLIAAWWNPTPS